jgi:hypothetical protein
MNVGVPGEVDWEGRTVRTGIWKESVEGRRRVGRLNVEGDGQGDLLGHGGVNRAVFVYQIVSYRYWQEFLGRSHRPSVGGRDRGRQRDDALLLGHTLRVAGARVRFTRVGGVPAKAEAHPSALASNESTVTLSATGCPARPRQLQRRIRPAGRSRSGVRYVKRPETRQIPRQGGSRWRLRRVRRQGLLGRLGLHIRRLCDPIQRFVASATRVRRPHPAQGQLPGQGGDAQVAPGRALLQGSDQCRPLRAGAPRRLLRVGRPSERRLHLARRRRVQADALSARQRPVTGLGGRRSLACRRYSPDQSQPSRQTRARRSRPDGPIRP